MKRNQDVIRKASVADIPRLMDLLHQVNMVHHHLRPELFKPNTTKYSEQELETLLGDESKPIFVYDDGEVLGYAFCQITKPNNMIRLNCFFQAADAAKYKDALRAAVALTEKSRNHAGCIAYDVFQSATRSDVFMFCETWKDDASLKAHAETPEFKKYVAEIEACGQMKLERFEF